MVRRTPVTEYEDYDAFIPWASVMVLVGPSDKEEETNKTTEEEKSE